MIALIAAALALPQDPVKESLSRLATAPPAPIAWSPREVSLARAVASPFSPRGEGVGLGNGLATWSIGNPLSEPPAIECLVGGARLGIGGAPAGGRAMKLVDFESTTFLKPFSVLGYPWPPRGATVRATFADPARPTLKLELRLDMVDGFPNTGIQVTVHNDGSEAVALESLTIKRSGAGLVLSESGSDETTLPIDAFVPPGRELQLPRVVTARTAVGGHRWPSGLWKALAPWTAKRSLMAWIRAGDVASARAQVQRAAQLGFQGVVVSVDHGDYGGVMAAVAVEAQAQKISSGFVLDASDFLTGSDLATPGDGHPCRTTQAAQRVVDRAMGWVEKNGMQVLVDATDWSHDCRSPLHDAHQAERGFAFADGQAQRRGPLYAVSHGIRLISRRDLRLAGASAVLDTAWSPPPQTGADFAVAVTRPHGVVPLAAKIDWPEGAVKNWVKLGGDWTAALAYPLATRAAEGRAAAAQLDDGSVFAVLAAGARPGVEAAVTTPFASGTRVSLSSGGQAVVGPEGSVTLKTATPANAAGVVILRPLK